MRAKARSWGLPAAEYEGDLDIDDALVEALIRTAMEIEKRVRALKPLV